MLRRQKTQMRQTNLLAKTCREWGLVAQHVLVNLERVKRKRPLLKRNVELDQMARQMAEKIVLGEWKVVVRMQMALCQMNMAQVVQKGKSIECIHAEIMKRGIKRNDAKKHILSKKHNEFGMATARYPKGDNIVLVQVFKR